VHVTLYFKSSKPHASDITQLTMSSSANILVCGSDDCSIFIYKIETEPFTMNPIGMYPLPGKVTFIYWKPSEVKYFIMILWFIQAYLTLVWKLQDIVRLLMLKLTPEPDSIN